MNRYKVPLCISWSEYNPHAHVPVPENSIEMLRQDRMGGGGGVEGAQNDPLLFCGMTQPKTKS